MSQTVSSFTSKSLNLTGGWMLWVLVWIPGTDAFVSSGTAPLVEVLAGLVGLTCRTGSLCTSLSGLVSGFTCPDGFLAGFRNCLFLLNVVPPDRTMYDLKASQRRFLSPMFDSYEVVWVSLPVQFPALATAWCFCLGRIWPLAFQLKTIHRAVIYCRMQQTCSGWQQGMGFPWHKPLGRACTYAFCGGVTIVK